MSKSSVRQERNIAKKIKRLKEEILANDKILDKNINQLRNQMQEGLYKLGYPVGSVWYDSLLEKMKLDLEENQLKIDSGFEVLNPIFSFQKHPRWIEIQKITHERNSVALKENIAEIEKNVEKVQLSIAEQNERIRSRRLQIIEDLKKLGQDVSELESKTPDYIG